MIIGELTAAFRGLWRYGATPAAVGFLAGRRSRPVLIDDDGVVTGPQLWAAVTATAALWSTNTPISARSTRQRIGLLCDQDRSFVIALLAASTLGWDTVGLSPRQDDARLTTLIDRHAITAVAGPDHVRVTKIAGDRPALSIIESDDVVDSAARPRRRGRVIMLSSGTTGPATASARRRYGPAVARPVVGLWRLLRPVGGPMMIMAPIWHGYGLGMLHLALAGGVPALLTRHRSSVQVAAVAEHRQPRTIVLLPVQLAALVDRWPRRPLSVHRVITGSAPLSPELCRRALKVLGPRLINLYGSTESGWATWATADDLARTPGTVGRAAPGVRLVVTDGLVHVDSPLGTDPRRPTPTGDLGHLDDQGCLVIDGRVDDIVIIDGNNVSLSMVRQALDDLPGIGWAEVCARTDPIHGHRLLAEVRICGDSDLPTIRKLLGARLDWYAIPELRAVKTTDD